MDILYSWGEKWSKLWQKGATIMLIMMIFVTLFFYAMVVFLTIREIS